MLNAPDIFYAAAVLTRAEFFEGRGDRTKLIEFILANDPTLYPKLGKKLRLLNTKSIGDSF